jgi:signal recognition particle subunit SRP54
MIKNMGPLDQLMKMIPGASAAMKEKSPDPDELVRVEAVISSMTMQERKKPGIVNSSRKRRIAMGSGRDVMDVNRTIKDFQKMKKMMKGFGKMRGKKSMMQNPLAGLGLGN